MLNREDFKKSVYERAENQLKEKNRRKKRMIRTVTPICICVFILTAFLWSWNLAGGYMKTDNAAEENYLAEGFEYSSDGSAPTENISEETCAQTTGSTKVYQYHKKYSVSSFRTTPLKQEKKAFFASYLHDYTALKEYYERNKDTYDLTEFQGALNKYDQSYFDDGNALILIAIFDSGSIIDYTVTDVTSEGNQLSVYVRRTSEGVKNNRENCTHMLVPVEKAAFQDDVNLFIEN